MARPDLARTIAYYDAVWLPRLREGHNPKSRAIHFGLRDERRSTGSDESKLATNVHVERWTNAAPEDPLRAADLGCGAGGTAIHLATRNRSWRITGVDVVPGLIDLGRRVAADARVDDRVRFVHGSYDGLPLPDGSIDVAWFVDSLCYSTRPTEVLEEARRVLAPEGRLIVADFMRPPVAFEPERADLYDTARRGFAVPGFFDVPLAVSLERAGFEIVERHELTNRVLRGVFMSASRVPAPGRSSEVWLAHRAACRALLALLRTGSLEYVGVVARPARAARPAASRR